MRIRYNVKDRKTSLSGGASRGNTRRPVNQNQTYIGIPKLEMYILYLNEAAENQNG